MVNTRSSAPQHETQNTTPRNTNPPPNPPNTTQQPTSSTTPRNTNPPPNPSNTTQKPTSSNADLVALQLASIASKLETIDFLAAEVAALKAETSGVPPADSVPGITNKGKTKDLPSGSREPRRYVWSKAEDDDVDSPWWRRNPASRPHTKMEFPKFEGGDPRGWILKAEKYFRYYQTPDELKVDIAAMYLEGDALDLFSWLNNERTLIYWDELVKALQESYGPAEFQNPNEHLCSIRQTGTIQEYRQEFAKRSARVSN